MLSNLVPNNVVYKQADYPSERIILYKYVNIYTLLQFLITVNKLLQYTKLIIRITTITYTIYLNCVGTSIISSLLITPVPPLFTHPL